MTLISDFFIESVNTPSTDWTMMLFEQVPINHWVKISSELKGSESGWSESFVQSTETFLFHGYIYIFKTCIKILKNY